jgi:hypothetical protein
MALTKVDLANQVTGLLPVASVPNPSASTLGGVQSFTAVTSNWIRQISTAGVPTASQPLFSDISGTVTGAQLPNPSASTLGGIQSIAAVATKFLSSISTSGVPALTQPAFTDISGILTNAQIPNQLFGAGVNAQVGITYTVVSTDENKLVTLSNAASIAVTLPIASAVGFTAGAEFHFKNQGVGTVTITPTTSQIDGAATLVLTTGNGVDLYSDGTNYFTQHGMIAFPSASTLGGIQSIAGVATKFISSISTLGVPALTQPAFTDISGTAAAAQLPVATTGAFGAVKPDGTTITIAAGVISASGTLPTFVDGETPGGLINSSNPTYTLAFAPGTSLSLYLNGILQKPGSGNDYTLSTLTVTMLNVPATGDSLLANYRH